MLHVSVLKTEKNLTSMCGYVNQVVDANFKNLSLAGCEI